MVKPKLITAEVLIDTLRAAMRQASVGDEAEAIARFLGERGEATGNARFRHAAGSLRAENPPGNPKRESP